MLLQREEYGRPAAQAGQIGLVQGLDGGEAGHADVQAVRLQQVRRFHGAAQNAARREDISVRAGELLKRLP